MDARDCEHWDACDAQLCPLDRESLLHCSWFPDEEICKLQKARKLLFIKQQKKLQKKCHYTDTYFLYSMLSKKRRLGNTRGLDPDLAEAKQLRKWLKNHPEIRELKDEEKERMRISFIENVSKKNKKQK